MKMISLDLPKRLFSVPVYLPYVQPRLTVRAIEKAEAQLGVKLPSAYLAAMRVQNGGYLRLSVHPSAPAPVEDLAGIGPRFPSILRNDWDHVKAYMAENKIKKPRRIDDLVSFSGDGHYHFCFDYRRHGRTNEPQVCYIDVESFDVDKVLAPDFLTFLHQLQAEPEHAYGISASESIETVAATLSKASGYQFEDQGDGLYSYPTFRAILPSTGANLCAWLTPNRVRRFSVKKDDRQYAKYARRLAEFALRYPEHAIYDYFLKTDFDTDAGQVLVRALWSLPYQTRAIVLE